MSTKKIGRNDKCPCGSGNKYKRCCIDKSTLNPQSITTVKPIPFSEAPPELLKIFEEQQKKERERIAKQGHGKPIISIDFQGKKLVAVRGRLYNSSQWKTFHDFLFYYIRVCLGPSWGTAEIKKPFEERHTILKWYDALCTFQKKQSQGKSAEILMSAITGPVGAYLSLAYDLYTLDHNAALQNRLIPRLKNKDQFQGVRYEIYVAASLIRAGFDIEFEDETDRTKSHCEFVGTHGESKRKYSVEVKSRHRPGILGHKGEQLPWEKISPRIGELLNTALRKNANHTRIVFIDINMPPETGTPLPKRWHKKLNQTVEATEKRGLDGSPCPPAYLIFTNHPRHYVGDEELEPQQNFAITGINIPEVKIPDIKLLPEKEPPIFHLFDSLFKFSTVPHEFE